MDFELIRARTGIKIRARVRVRVWELMGVGEDPIGSDSGGGEAGGGEGLSGHVVGEAHTQ